MDYRGGDTAGVHLGSAADLRVVRGPAAQLHAQPEPPCDKSELSLQVVTAIADLATLRPDYEQLNCAAANTSPFALFDWHLAWCTHFMNLDPQVRDLLFILVLRNRDRDCVAIVPLVASQRRFGPFKIVSIELLGADPSTTEARTPLIEAGYEQPTARAVRGWLLQYRDWDWITWGGVEDWFGRALTAGTGVQPQASAPAYVLDLPHTWEQFRAGLKRNIRESLRHCRNSLKRDGHEMRFEVLETQAAVRSAVERFVDLHARRAQMTGTVEHPDHFATAVARRFLFDVCERLAARGEMRVFQLRIGADVVAIRLGFVVRDSLYLYYSGFDPQWARYGVMTTVLVEALKYAIAHGFKSVNLSRGTDTSKTRWTPRVVAYTHALELRQRLRSRIAYRCYVSARSGKGLRFRLLRLLGKGRRAWN